jgi:hypothetical protein
LKPSNIVTNPSKKLDVQKVFAIHSDDGSIMVSAYINGVVEAMEFHSTTDLKQAKKLFTQYIHANAKYYAKYEP